MSGELLVISACGNKRTRVNSSRSVGECGREIKTRQHCMGLDPDAAPLSPYPLLGDCSVIHLQCRKPAPLIVLPRPQRRTQTERNPNIFPPFKDYTSADSLPPPPVSRLINSFISQTSVGTGESLISQGLSFRFHY